MGYPVGELAMIEKATFERGKSSRVFLAELSFSRSRIASLTTVAFCQRQSRVQERMHTENVLVLRKP
jgi:hypothetical protein